ncbi:MAG: hypothetical protein ABII64_02435 [Elusimicrobiota bacterium]
MVIDRFKLKATDFCLRRVTKEVSVSKSGHGVVVYRISAVRTSPGARYIMHRFGPEEGVPPKVCIPDIKAMSQNYHKHKFGEVVNGNTFMIKGIAIPVIKAHWQLADKDGNSQAFLLDTVRTFGYADEFSYSWAWSFERMFDRKTPKGLFTSYRSYYPMEEFIMQLGFGMEYKFKKVPRIVVLNPKGEKEAAKRMQQRPEASEFCGYGYTVDDIVCKYYIADINYPQEDYTYRIEWVGNNK